jgi:hypothetical protein
MHGVLKKENKHFGICDEVAEVDEVYQVLTGVCSYIIR